ncbi:sodium-independent anion transporter [Thermoflavimicrobium daqui]|jgi:SulP family sulfate permease|uniref:Sodium-independent anion transporter n=1 Tax=Thermoflavimicrobium daqui TaxID=2137476 RepID=A0A364K112_9BACL|nr:sodium-independent anion transporter [Thermoflavimicrobium daqui]
MNFKASFRSYTFARFQRDLMAGLIVGIVAIPLGIAFAVASGVRPEYGIYTTIVAGALISLFGGSKYQIGGPTGAFVPILLGIVLNYGYENLLIAGFLAGIMLILMGIMKLGNLISYIPQPVTIGFTAGIAVTIFSGQIANFLGLRNVKKKEGFIANMEEIIIHLETFNIYSIVTALICFSVLWLSSFYFPKFPAPLFGLFVSTLVAVFFFPNQVDTIGSVYGKISTQLPSIQFPKITWEKIMTLLPPALSIALLGGIESLLSAVVADRMSGEKHRSNKELIGQGIANIATPLFGGIPATGAIARTATNIKSGATSPVAGVTHSMVVLLVLWLFFDYAAYIPLACFAPILMVIAWKMSERKEFMHILKSKKSDAAILTVTFLLTVLIDLVVGVGCGLLLASILCCIKIAKTIKVKKDLTNKQVIILFELKD